MIVTIHQPEHLSYLGFWDKISSAETLNNQNTTNMDLFTELSNDSAMRSAGLRGTNYQTTQSLLAGQDA